MTNLNQPYTLGRWFVKPGNEETFIAEWKSFARWTSTNQPGAGTGYLLQDPEHPHEFISFGAWDNVEVIKAWRQRPEFKAFVDRVKPLCDDFQPHTLRLAATSKY
ncbi:MAG TPA: antibiotic biosynthesis monooxygenase family protein [Bacteroidota bacterium]|nr:antibiotic biosynthesis monooxygenase family protein [Bacteroidota bacterium]